MLDVEEDLATVAVVLDQHMERIRTVDPSEESRVGRERNDGVLDDGEVSLERLSVLLQERVDESKELHDSLVLSQILVSFEEEVVVFAIAPDDPQLSRTLLRREDLRRCSKAGDAHDALASDVGSGDGEVEVLDGEELRRDVLQLEQDERR